MPAHQQHRSTGLDALRALAIALVFTYHYMVFVSREPTFGWVSVVGWLGVDLFFVLSGYLIGNQLFAGMVRGEQVSLKNFYARRGLRTWPAFWVVLALYFLFPAVMGGKQPPPLWSFLTFTQNFGLQPGTAFSHAWSLCIEEQFYFVLPLFVLIALRVGGGRARAWMLLAALLAVGVISRAVLWSAYGREESGQIERYYPNVYYATLCRFDEFLPGIAVALLKNFHPGVWDRAQRHGQLVLLAGLAACGAVFYGAYNFYYIDGTGTVSSCRCSAIRWLRWPSLCWSSPRRARSRCCPEPASLAPPIWLCGRIRSFMAVRDRYFPSTFAAKPLLPATARP